MPERLTIFGASIRSAAQSAARGGISPQGSDLFGDCDLLEIACWMPNQDYPQGFLAASDALPDAPWIYTGGLENFPRLVDQLANSQPLLGNSGRVLRRVRDPMLLAETLRGNGLHCPEIATCPPLTGSGDADIWLLKPKRASGGHGIQVLRCESATITPRSAWKTCICQRFVSGVAHAATYVMAAGEASLCGVTRQLVGENWTNAAPFAYCGSIGPVELPDSILAQFVAIGNCLAAEFNLTGLIGVDTIISEDCVFVIEVNPRYTASVEVLERALNRSLLDEHIVACRDGRLFEDQHENLRMRGAGVERSEPPDCNVLGASYSYLALRPQPPDSRSNFVVDPKSDGTSRLTCCGKAILFGPVAIQIRPPFSEFVDSTNDATAWSPLADIPRVGTEIAQGHPVITVRVEAETPAVVENRLRQLLATVEGKLQESCLPVDTSRRD